MADTTLPRSDFYVYILLRPITAEPFYVGKGRTLSIEHKAKVTLALSRAHENSTIEERAEWKRKSWETRRRNAENDRNNNP